MTATRELDGDLYLMLAELYKEKRQYSDAVRCTVQAEEVFARGKEVLSYCKALYMNGLINYDRGDYGDSIERFKLVETKMLGIPYQNDFMIRVYTYTAMAYSAVFNSDGVDMYVAKSESQMAFVSPTEAFLAKGHHAYLAATRLFESGAHDDAISAYQKAQTFYDEISSTIDSLVMRMNIVHTYCAADRYHEAESKIKSLYEDQIKANAPKKHLIKTQMLTARIAFHCGDIDEAQKIFTDVTEDKDAGTYEITYSRNYLAKIELQRGDKEKYNLIMTSIIQELSQSPKYSHLAVQMMSDYMTVNHLKKEPPRH